MNEFDCVVIGGGAAGLMCAATAAQRGLRVAVLDRSNKVGKKILMSGGGRCNFTNYAVQSSNFLSANPHFCKSALKRYTPYHFIELVQKHGVAYHEKSLGQLFCDNSSRDILDLLLAECKAAAVTIQTRCEIHAVVHHAEAEQARFTLDTSLGAFTTRSLVVASGGLSIPSLGSSGFGYDLARQFGLRLVPRQAALVPFTLQGEDLLLAQALAGVALPVTASAGGASFSEALLFTHRGLSGPAMLQVSSYWNSGECVEIDFLPGLDLAALLAGWQNEGAKSELKNLLARHLPKRFVIAWLETRPTLKTLQGRAIAQLSKADIESLRQAFQHWQCAPAGTEGYKTAEVTRGGVDTDEVSSKTFEAKNVGGLFFIGEVLDVTGWLGGYNFQWAWASGHCAAQYV